MSHYTKDVSAKCLKEKRQIYLYRCKVEVNAEREQTRSWKQIHNFLKWH